MPTPITPKREAEIVDAYHRHGNTKTVAYVVCASQNTVRRVVRAAGLLRPNHRPFLPLPCPSELRRLVKHCGSHRAAARVLGCHVNTLRNRLYGRTS